MEYEYTGVTVMVGEAQTRDNISYNANEFAKDGWELQTVTLMDWNTEPSSDFPLITHNSASAVHLLFRKMVVRSTG